MVEMMEDKTIKKVKVGDILQYKEVEKQEGYVNGRIPKTSKKYTVQKVYKYFVIAICENDKRCFNIGDLVMMGIEP